MTALAGFWRFEPSGSSKQACERMLQAQHAYGLGRAVCSSDGSLAIGRRLTTLLPEDVHDRGPVTGGNGRFSLVADVRLDNRDEIATDLKLTHSECSRLSDSGVLMKAWELWEEKTLHHIVGDFAFALWDRVRSRLILARDFAGQRPLCFSRNPEFLAFASMPRGLHALSDVPYEVDRQALREFLAYGPEESPRTFFEGVERVQPGHLVTVTPSGIRATKYWQPALRPIRFGNSEHYAEALREKLDQAVAARLRGAEGRVAAHLSAGLDSSGVVATAARLLHPGGTVTAFTSVPRQGFPGPVPAGRIADEGSLAGETAAMYRNVEQVLVRSHARSPLDEFDRSFHLYQRPLPNPCNYTWATAIHEAAKERGLTVLLTGQLGNFGFSHSGMELLPQLLARGGLLRLGREAVLLQRNGVRLRNIASNTFAPFLPKSAWKSISKWRGVPTKVEDVSLAIPAKLGSDSLKDGDDYSRRPSTDGVQARLDSIKRLDFGNFNKGVLAGWGIDTRDPTADRRLVEFCLSVPSEEFLKDGVTRSLARRALADRLPPNVLYERRRGYQSADWYEGLSAARLQVSQEADRISRSADANAVMDIARMLELVEDWPSTSWETEKTGDLYRGALLRGLSAGHFARKTAGSNE